LIAATAKAMSLKSGPVIFYAFGNNLRAKSNQRLVFTALSATLANQ
jgi:hypothetical protein